jgi:alpha-amylase/alpha-mannosidase (GH57 family)
MFSSMTNKPLYVAFLWHMHQPYYRDPMTGLYRLPWVRLHGTKDYLDMVEILRDFPLIRQNFNLVPSLLEQLLDYTEHGAKDVFLEVGRKPADELSQDERVFILENFFLANWDTMIRPFPRYYELLMKRGVHVVRSALPRVSKYFSEGDFRDLQVFFNLSWMDPTFRSTDPLLKMLSERGRNYTEDDKRMLFDKQFEILRRIIPAYREMYLKGQIELSFSPFYHPILPLLCDTDVARVAMPDVRLPEKRFRHPEDAEKQITEGRTYLEKTFGRVPSGMWPSEGSVSEEVLRISSRLGIKWVGTDEGILSNSLRKSLRDQGGTVIEPHLLYMPHTCEGVSIVFRDRAISDLIGFTYSRWEPKKAADDLIQRLLNIRSSLSTDSPHLVSIILDGENAWEYYENDGRDFFLHLYEGLSREKRLQTITISDFIDSHGHGERLGSLYPGSWINSNFAVWIGHEEDNQAWDYLAETRNALEVFSRQGGEPRGNNAWKALYTAEGSDWNWWYGDDHTTESQEDFDALFRNNLIACYREMGRDVPEHFFEAILRRDREITPALTVRGFIRPKIDGLVTSYYEWYQGAQLDVKKSGGSMHKSESLISTVYFGFDKDNLFLRIDAKIPFSDFSEGTEIAVFSSGPAPMRITCPVKSGLILAELSEKRGEDWEKVKDLREAAIKDVFEIGIPFAELKAGEKDELNLFISVRRGGEEIERCPWRGYLTVSVPTADFESMMWY